MARVKNEGGALDGDVSDQQCVRRFQDKGKVIEQP